MDSKHITTGPWSFNPGNLIVAPGGIVLADVRREGIQDAETTEANGQIMAEAGTVYHETGLTPRQLADQRTELLEALQAVMAYVRGEKSEYADPLGFTDEAINNATQP